MPADSQTWVFVSRSTYFYSGSKANAHPFTGVDEADNWAPFDARSYSWICYGIQACT